MMPSDQLRQPTTGCEMLDQVQQRFVTAWHGQKTPRMLGELFIGELSIPEAPTELVRKPG